MVQKGRSRVLRGLVVGVLVILAGRLVWVQGVKAAEIVRKGEEARLVKKEIKPVRGAILDRMGRQMAVSVPYNSVFLNAQRIPDAKARQDVAGKLAQVLKMDAGAIVKLIEKDPENGHILLKKGLGLEDYRAVENLHLDGVDLEQGSIRSYPMKSTANQVIGYLDPDGHGASGLESFYDAKLAGTAGFTRAEFTLGNVPIDGTIKEQVDPVPGYDLVLGIDAGLQRFVEAKLEEVVKQQHAKRGLTIIMDPHTGEILTMAMRPGADLSDRSTWGSPVDFSKLNNWALEPLPPGSIFKPLTTSMALEEKAITLSTTFIDKGYLVIDGWRIINWDGNMPPKPRPETIAELLQRSSNIGLIQVGQRIQRDAFVKYLRGFGFLDKTGIDLAPEGEAIGASGFDQKKDVEWANMYIGQHMEPTPIQTITALASIANGGYLVQPHLVREIRDPQSGKVVWTAPTAAKHQVISEETTREVRDLMVSVVEKGSAIAAKTDGWVVAGKTGTAQKFENGKMKERNVANFIGMVPANNPQLIALIMIDEPDNPGYGGQISAPMFHDILPEVMRTIGVPPATSGEEKAPPKVVQGVVPDVAWLPAAWAQQRLADAGFAAKLTGQGKLVQAQSLKAGSAAKGGTVVELTLAAAPAPDAPVHVPDFTGLSLTEATQLASEVGVTLKASGTGFVASQDPKVGTVLPARSTLSVRMAPH